jgi:CRP-like cAMP-binding protein
MPARELLSDPLAALAPLPPAVEAALETRSLGRGERLFRAGDAAWAVFAVARGRLRLERSTADGRAVVLHTALPGGLLAEAALHTPCYHCDAVALVRSRVVALPTGALRAALAGDPGFAARYQAYLARSLMALRARLELLAVRPAHERVFLALALVAAPVGPGPAPSHGSASTKAPALAGATGARPPTTGRARSPVATAKPAAPREIPVHLHGSLRQLAGELALTPEALYRALATLRREGRLVGEGRQLRLRVQEPRER